MIEALTMPVILLALANGIRQWRAMRERQSQRDFARAVCCARCKEAAEVCACRQQN